MTYPMIRMTEIQNLVSKVLDNPDYSLEANGFDVTVVVEVAVKEQMPKHYNELDQSNFELELGSELETLYDKYFEPDYIQDY